MQVKGLCKCKSIPGLTACLPSLWEGLEGVKRLNLGLDSVFLKLTEIQMTQQ